jgi:hypothetical protein
VPCGGEEERSSLQELLAADGEELKKVFQETLGADAVKALRNPNEKELKRELTSLPDGTGLLFVYSGHGIEIPDPVAANRMESALCLSGLPGKPQAPLRSGTLLGWLDARPPRFFSMFVSACRSSYVDVSRQKYPTSAFTISPEDIEEQAPEPREHRATTHVAAALAAAVRDGSDTDESCDGWVSDRELFGAVADKLRLEVPFTQRSLIMPRLRRQAAEPIQLWRAPGSPSSACRARTDEVRRVLGPELNRELERRALGRPAAKTTADYFYLHSAKTHLACAGRNEIGRGVLSGTMAEICHALRGAGWKPLPLSETQGRCDEDGGCSPPMGHEIALSVDSAEIYYVHVEGRWIHFDRLRDGRRVATFQEHMTSAEIPRRDSVVARWPLGDFVVRFAGMVPASTQGLDEDVGLSITDSNRAVVVCAEREGQCFLVKAPEKLNHASVRGEASNE